MLEHKSFVQEDQTESLATNNLQLFRALQGLQEELNTPDTIEQERLEELTLLLAQVSFEQLRQMLKNPSLWDTRQQSGYELESVVTHSNFRPRFSPVHHENFPQCDFAKIGGELLTSNLEASSVPISIGKNFLRQLEASMTASMLLKEQHIKDRVNGSGVEDIPRLVLGGMLPTYHLDDFKDTDTLGGGERYQRLNAHVMSKLGGSFQLQFEGLDKIDVQHTNMCSEGVPTSLQLHMSATPDELVKLYNAGLAAMGPVLAVATNSPFVLENRGWHESRVPVLEKGATPDRFLFAPAWVASPVDLFQDAMKIPALMPFSKEETQDAIEAVSTDLLAETPQLDPLMRHNGTVWKWLRPCYGVDEHFGPHLRMEMRALPAGPTEVDMAANAAFFYGLVEGLKTAAPDLCSRMSIESAAKNFQAAAKDGLSAQIDWFEKKNVPIAELASHLLELADYGLAQLGVEQDERAHYLGVIEERIANRQNGSSWALDSLEHLENTHPEKSREEHFRCITACQWYNQQKSRHEEPYPVARWPLAEYSTAAEVLGEE